MEEVAGRNGWIERRLGCSGTAFSTTRAARRSGLVNQGWKDSQDSIFHADGHLPSGPIAVVEVQGYCLRRVPGNGRAGRGARRCEAQARAGRARARSCDTAIEERFWMRLNFYAYRDRLATATVRAAGACLQCRAPAVLRRAECGARPTGDHAVARAGIPPAAGASARWPRTRPASIRCPITMARSGRTIRQSARPASPAMAGASRRCRC